MAIVTRYQPDKCYQEIRFNLNKKLPAAELNELQDIVTDFRRYITQVAFGEGNQYQDSWRVVEHPVNTSNQVMVLPGPMIMDSYRVLLDEPITISGLSTPLVATTYYVWVRFSLVIVDGLEDPAIVDGGLGETSHRVLLEPEFIVMDSTDAPALAASQWNVLLAKMDRPAPPASSAITQAYITDERRVWWDSYVEKGFDLSFGGTSLSRGYTSGRVIVGGTRYQINSGTVTLSSASTAYMYVDTSGSVNLDTVIPEGDAYGKNIPLYKLASNASNIIYFEDLREFVGGNPLVIEEIVDARAQFNSINDRFDSPSGSPWLVDALFSDIYANVPSGSYGYHPTGFVDLDSRLENVEEEVVTARGTSGVLYGAYDNLGFRLDNIEGELINAHTSHASSTAYFSNIDERFENIEQELVATHTSLSYAASGLTSGFARLHDRLEYTEGVFIVPALSSTARGSAYADLDERFEDGELEVVTARGTMPSLDARLDVFISDNGDIQEIIDARDSSGYVSGFGSLDERIEYGESDVIGGHFSISVGEANSRLERYLGCAGVGVFRSGDAASGYTEVVVTGTDFEGLDLGVAGTFVVSVPSSADQVGDVTYVDVTSGFRIYNSGSNYWSNFRWHLFSSY